MLEKIREGSQGPAAKIILGVVILSFALAGIGGYLGQTTEQPVAEVNGAKISQTEFARAYQNERARLEQQFGEYFAQISADPAYMARIREGVVDRLVQQELQNQLALELGLRVSDEQVKNAILEMPYFQLGGQFSNDRYLQLIRQMNFQPDTFREYLREEMTRNQLVTAVAGSDFMLPSELKSAIALQQQTRDLDYLVLNKGKLADQVEVSEQEIKDYYQLNQSQFQSPERVAVQYLELKASDVTPTKEISEDDVLAYYEESKNQYTEPEKRRVAHILVEGSAEDAEVQQKAQAILEELKGGADFAELAQEKSDDVVSAEIGGDLDWIERDMMDPEFEAAAFALENVGDITDVVASEFGLHVIKLTDIQRQQVKEYDDVKDELRAELERAEKVDAFYQKQTEVTELAFEIADSLEDAAIAAGVELKSTELLARNALPAPLNTPAVSSAIFTPEVLEDRVNSGVLEVGNEHIVVVRVQDYQAAAPKPLEEVSAQIKTKLVNDKASSLIKEHTQALFAQLQDGKSLEEIAAGEELEVQSDKALNRQSYSLSPAIVSKAFQLPHPVEGQPQFAMVELNNGDAALLKLNSVTTPEVSDDIDAQQKQSISMAQINQNYNAFVSALEAQAEVKRPKINVTEEN
ncbi:MULTISPECIES: peptidylprolyl isomerase [Pseudoalteromonas]|uniref:Periplasmic chaperone PpiD n=1 Tax=Pseudoalteromonas amylolytica TaxID=1859457 RepID=A0A1S1MVA1_9GAMM|nr:MULTISPECIES: peptidylprolyl isomerase [Pseudoalteromonas]OHU87510.1 peptidylprolyl isomerase [Pseudoalteromonas sp. JW3]OHU90953.1 peptidylprolyl isomerase [Pseudoalteromonas amylolytica]